MTKVFRSKTWLDILDILFPQCCLACGIGLENRQEISYCGKCRQTIRFILEPYCTICGKPFDKAAGTNHLCGHCLRKGWFFKKARAAVGYQSPIAEAVKIFKYNGKMSGLATFAALSQNFLRLQPLEQPDLVIPVPLHRKRLRQRGFNQALILSKKIFPEYITRINTQALKRHIWIRPQTGLKGAERLKNVKNAFMVCKPEEITNKKILLVDDVFTTGATVNECARILLKNRAAEVHVFTFARVLD
jgi:ComF family protein